MKKLLSIIVFSLLLNGNAYAETISQRLDKIEERLEKIEESLDGTNLLKNLLGNNENLKVDVEPPKTKIAFKLNLLSCTKDSVFEQINVGYKITNNYDKLVKIIDANFVTKDLLGDLVFRGGIGRDLYLAPGKSKTLEGTYDGLGNADSCKKIRQSRLPDLKVDLYVVKIAFGDNTIIEFNKAKN
jgi:hypothetical protein